MISTVRKWVGKLVEPLGNTSSSSYRLLEVDVQGVVLDVVREGEGTMMNPYRRFIVGDRIAMRWETIDRAGGLVLKKDQKIPPPPKAK